MSDLAIDPLVATATAVTMTLVDAANNSWVGAKVIVTFVAAPNTTSSYLWNGATFQMNYYYENIGNTNVFSINLPSNLDISPRGDLSFWRFDVAPNIDDMRSVSFTVQISTAAMDLSAAFKFASQNLVQFPVQSIPVPRATGDTAVAFTPNDGQLYFDITLQKLKVWSGISNSWLALDTGAASGMVYPPAGIPVSTGTAWGTSLDPNNSYLKLTGGTLTGRIDSNSPIVSSSGIYAYLGLDGTSGYGFDTTSGRINMLVNSSIAFYGDYQTGLGATVPLTLAADPTTALQAATKQYVDNHLAGYLPLTGGTLSGTLVMGGNNQLWFADQYNFITCPTSDSYLQIAGNNGISFTTWNGTQFAYWHWTTYPNIQADFYCPVMLQADPTSALQAATKQYVDNNFVPLTSTANITIEHDNYSWTLQGTAPPATAASGANSNGWINLYSGDGQGTTGTSGQTGGNGASIALMGGKGGDAPAGSTNGIGGAVYIDGGASGGGAGTASRRGRVYISSAGGDTYIGGDSTHPAVLVTYGGNLSAVTLNVTGTKNFKIDHPTKPGYSLVHSCVEGPEAAVYYRGEDITDEFGMCEVTLPDYFEALVRPQGRTVQVTAIFEDDDEEFSYVAAGRVLAGRFKVRSTLVDQKFYWEVKAIRADVPELEVEVLK